MPKGVLLAPLEILGYSVHIVGMTQNILPLPVLPLRDVVVFPHMIVPLFVGRPKSVVALEHAMKNDRQVLMVTQKDTSNADRDDEGLFETGTIGTILQMLKLPDGTVKALVEGGKRARIDLFRQTDPFLEADVEPVVETGMTDKDPEVVVRALMSQFESYVKLNRKIPPEVVSSAGQISDPGRLADLIGAHLSIKIDEKQKLLDTVSVQSRIEMVYAHMDGEIGVLQVEKRLRTRVKRQMERSHREFYLNEQMKAIQKELTESEDGASGELVELEKKINQTRLTKEAKEKALGELKKLKMMPPMAAEATVIRNYLDWMVSIPWKKQTKVKRDLHAAQAILDHDHYGLDKVKDRIMEYLAVQQRTGRVKGSILCLVGPPGVGKTSLGQSVARATNRHFVRVALGGVRDESEIRGHRRTYIGSQPGKIVQGMKKAKSSNPLFLLDEIDKMASDWRGDPASALLEVLDPEQNHTFNDHYLEVDYDLSDVMFICTANSLDMPSPLLDRMEIIRLSGYTEDEKVEIVKRHLLHKQIKASGLKEKEFFISDAAIQAVIRHYTREAGVRSLDREISKLCRKAVKDILMNKTGAIDISPDNLEKFLGVPKFRIHEMDQLDRVGVVNGLAYTEFGGDLLSIEAVTIPGKDGKVSMTGNLKDVMKESITVAEMLVKSRAASLGIDYDILKELNIHVHVPEGATPKDGPSAGAAMTTAIVSAITGIPIKRHIAMTGEVNLRGYVTEIGGLKEKLLAALRGGIKTVLIPKDNEKDLADIPANVKQGLDIIPVSTVDQVFSHALTARPEPLAEDRGGVVSDFPISSSIATDGFQPTIH